MHAPRLTTVLRRTSPLIVAAAVFVAAGGFVHLREWLDTYRHVPAAAPGAALVRIGFPLNAGASLLLAVALLSCLAGSTRRAVVVIAAAAAFQAGSLTTLILTRTGSVLGWSEPVWNRGATQARAVEAGALVVLAAVIAVGLVQRRAETIAHGLPPHPSVQPA